MLVKIQYHTSNSIPELWLCPLLAFYATAIQLRNSQGHAVINVLIQHTHNDNGKRCKGKIEEDDVSVVEDVLGIEVGVDLVPEERKDPDDVLFLLAAKSL